MIVELKTSEKCPVCVAPVDRIVATRADGGGFDVEVTFECGLARDGADVVEGCSNATDVAIRLRERLLAEGGA